MDTNGAGLWRTKEYGWFNLVAYGMRSYILGDPAHVEVYGVLSCFGEVQIHSMEGSFVFEYVLSNIWGALCQIMCR